MQSQRVGRRTLSNTWLVFEVKLERSDSFSAFTSFYRLLHESQASKQSSIAPFLESPRAFLRIYNWHCPRRGSSAAPSTHFATFATKLASSRSSLTFCRSRASTRTYSSPPIYLNSSCRIRTAPIIKLEPKRFLRFTRT